MSSLAEDILKPEFKDNPSPRLVNLHIWFQYFSPFAVFILLLYVIGTTFYHPPRTVIMSSRIFLSVFFGLEILVEFRLYKSKTKFIKHYWWRGFLVVPVVGFLRIIGQLAQLSQLLSIVKMAEKAIDSVKYYFKNDK